MQIGNLVMNIKTNSTLAANSVSRLLLATLGCALALAIGLAAWLLRSQEQASVGLEFNSVVELDAPSKPGDQRALAMQAYTSGKLFAPAGENALEHYLNARQKQSNDYSLQEAVLELLPAAMDALEVAMSNQDQAETNRLFALLARADPKSVRLATLKTRWDNQQLAVAQRQQANQMRAAMPVATPTPARATAQNAAAAQFLDAMAPQNKSAVDVTASLAASAKPTVSTQKPIVAVAVSDLTRATPRNNASTEVRSPSVIAARAIRTAAPAFPAEARRRKVQGWVDLELEIDTEGQVVKATVTASEPSKIFDVEARRAALRWRFTPKLVDETPTASTVRRRINFNLNG
jgi:periplasmic protein TonB